MLGALWVSWWTGAWVGISPLFGNMSIQLQTCPRGYKFNFALVDLFSVTRSSALGRFQITFEKFRALFLSITLLHRNLGLVPISAIHRFGHFQPGFLMCYPSCDFSQLVWISQTGYGKRSFSNSLTFSPIFKSGKRKEWCDSLKFWRCYYIAFCTM